MKIASVLRLIIITTALIASGVALAKSLPRYGALVYSNLCVEPQSGDIGGTRITLLRFADGDKVIYEYTEGAVNWPLFAQRGQVDSKTGAIGFKVQTGSETLSFEGKFTDAALTGAFGGKSESISLPRVADLRRPMPNCK